jgi:hypothetical protein
MCPIKFSAPKVDMQTRTLNGVPHYLQVNVDITILSPKHNLRFIITYYTFHKLLTNSMEQSPS